MDDKLGILNFLTTAINKRIHFYHPGKSNMFHATKDIWYHYIYHSIVSMAENCSECTDSCMNLKNLISKQDMEKSVEHKDHNEAVQLDFWGPISYLN